ncbi:hypothetical protein BAE44_0022360 [Dichanthelium oligosanthes]|uniref:Uncharacterized protein n=1 Tax=Dichanthelium oligosanthes TaxID=888268 RepID=A0A1E5UUL7_9POAL|nr:hypothetical protein BAE44_0022360 [Dichanthelium oligosanthes]
MEANGDVLVTHDALGVDLRQALFGRVMPEFFALPLDVKRGLVSGAVNGDTVGTFAKNMMDLERTVVTMILESLGVREEHVDAHH